MRRLTFVLLGLALLCALFALPPVHGVVLRRAGLTLVAEDSLAPSDVVVLAPDVGDAGVLDSADLVTRGLAPRVVIASDEPSAIARELSRRGIPYEDAASRAVRLLQALGVPHAEILRLPAGGTEDAGRMLPDWLRRHGVRSVILVTGPDHSRRLRRVMRRNLDDSVRVTVRASRYTEFDAERWWRTRAGLRTGIVEIQKLLLDVLLHPFPS